VNAACSCITSSNSTSRGDDGSDGGGECSASGHDASGDCDPSDRGPGSGGSSGCDMDSCDGGGGLAAGSSTGAPSQSEPTRRPSTAGAGSSCWVRVHGANVNVQGSISRAAEPSSAFFMRVEPASL
jgi:hypothetical protein